MLNGLDYSMGMPSIQAMKQGNVAFVCRYVGWSDLSQAKILTPTEARTLSQNGIAIVSNYEWYGSRPQEGASAADVDAVRALQIHQSCGGPSNAPIYFSVDYDSPGSDVAEYFRELGRKLGIQRVGAYGGYRCIKYLFDNNLITWGWQTYAWSGGQWDSRAQIRQTQNSVQFGGIEVDFDTGMVDNVGQWKVGGITTPPPHPIGGPVHLNNFGMVLDVAQSYQLESGESGDLCGMWSVGSLLYANIPNGGIAPGTAEKIDVWADVEADKYGSHVTWGGSSIPDMENFFKDTGGRLHYWETQATADHVREAVRAGYPVLVTVYEPNLVEKTTGKRPYPWLVQANHIFPIVGLDKDGDFICADQLNNSFQGYWPPVYKANSFNLPGYMAIVQVVGPDPTHPWLAPIPGGDPLAWPANFNAQMFAGSSTGGTMLPPGFKSDDGTTLVANNGHKVVAGFRAEVLKEGANWDLGQPVMEEMGFNALPGNLKLGFTEGTFQVFDNGGLMWHSTSGVNRAPVGDWMVMFRDDFLKALAAAGTPTPSTPLTDAQILAAAKSFLQSIGVK